MWTSVEVSVGTKVHRGRYRMEVGQLVLEWRDGRVSERCGLLKPEVVASDRLRRLVAQNALTT